MCVESGLVRELIIIGHIVTTIFDNRRLINSMNLVKNFKGSCFCKNEVKL